MDLDLWTQEEDARLRKLLDRFGVGQWSVIAKQMKSRSADQCHNRYNSFIKLKLPRRVWTAEEDRTLIAAHNRLGDMWPEIAKELPGRTNEAVRQRWIKALKKKSLKADVTIRTGPWPQKEDDHLVELVGRFGTRNWTVIAKHMKCRTGYQCRHRWNRCLDPDIKYGTFTAEEDRIIINAHNRLGDEWAEIAKELPRRTNEAIRQRWKCTLKRKVDAAIKTSNEPMTRTDPIQAKAANWKRETRQQPVSAEGPSCSKRAIDANAVVHNGDGSRGPARCPKRRKIGPQTEVPAIDASAARPPVSSSNKMYLDELLAILLEAGVIREGDPCLKMR